jgi:hypothetical protein
LPDGNYLVMWWNILPHHKIFHDVAKYSLISHGIFCHITSMVCFMINNGLLTMTWVWLKKSSRATSCECLKPKINWRMHFVILHATNAPNVWCFWTIITIFFKMLTWVGIIYLKNIWWKLIFQKYIKYLTNMCCNGRSIIHKYTSLCNDWKVTKWKKKPLGWN